MTFSAPTSDFFDDGLVHSHDWSRTTPPGQHHRDACESESSEGEMVLGE